MSSYEQFPAHSYPVRAFPARALAHGGANVVIDLVAGCTYDEPSPRQGYPFDTLTRYQGAVEVCPSPQQVIKASRGRVAIPPWLDVSVQPSYGKGRAFVTWAVAAPHNKGAFFIYRSLDGNAPWKNINPLDTGGHILPIRGNHFEDQLLRKDSKLIIAHYRLAVRYDGKDYPSPIVGLLDKLSRHEYGAAQAMMQLEFLRMRSGNGIQVWLFAPLLEGKVAAGVDPDTQQKIAADCTGTQTDDGFGQIYAGGYNPGVVTWVEFSSGAQVTSKDSEVGTREESKQAARFLAFPRPQKGYLIVDPQTDDRYVVGDTVQPYRFKGVMPIAYDMEVELLDRNDPRYRVPCPL